MVEPLFSETLPETGQSEFTFHDILGLRVVQFGRVDTRTVPLVCQKLLYTKGSILEVNLLT